MEVLFAASSAALPTDAGRFTERELHKPRGDVLLHRGSMSQVRHTEMQSTICLF